MAFNRLSAGIDIAFAGNQPALGMGHSLNRNRRLNVLPTGQYRFADFGTFVRFIGLIVL